MHEKDRGGRVRTFSSTSTNPSSTRTSTNLPSTSTDFSRLKYTFLKWLPGKMDSRKIRTTKVAHVVRNSILGVHRLPYPHLHSHITLSPSPSLGNLIRILKIVWNRRARFSGSRERYDIFMSRADYSKTWQPIFFRLPFIISFKVKIL
jgi:hypothetical protein